MYTTHTYVYNTYRNICEREREIATCVPFPFWGPDHRGHSLSCPLGPPRVVGRKLVRGFRALGLRDYRVSGLRVEHDPQLNFPSLGLSLSLNLDLSLSLSVSPSLSPPPSLSLSLSLAFLWTSAPFGREVFCTDHRQPNVPLFWKTIPRFMRGFYFPD